MANQRPRTLGLSTIALAILLSPAMASRVAAQSNRPGTNTGYTFQQPGLPATFHSYDMFFTWLESPASGAIYPAFQFSFEIGGGYLGMQLEGATHKALFAVWDTATAAHSALPVGPNCTRFGDDLDLEGTGAHCGLVFDWQLGVEYRLRLSQGATVPGGVRWSVTIDDPTSGTSTEIGTIELRDSAGHAGYGGLTKDPGVFLENFGGSGSCDDQPRSVVQWRGPYADPDAGAFEPSRAWVGDYPCPRHNDVRSPSVPVVVNEAGGSGALIPTLPQTTLWGDCSYPFALDSGEIQIARNACFDAGAQAVAATTAGIPDYSAWSYPDGGSVHDSATAIANGGDAWVSFAKDPNGAGDTICLAPHQSVQLISFAGWNDALDSHQALPAYTSACQAPPGCTIAYSESGVCGDGVVQTACGEECDPGAAGADPCCDESCHRVLAGTACDDHDVCTRLDACDASGACAGRSEPEPVCKSPGRSTIAITDLAADSRDVLKWSWANGAATSPLDLGNPVLGATDYTACLYDTDASGSHAVFRTEIPHGGQCGRKPCWRAAGQGFRYAATGGSGNGVSSLVLVPGAAGRAKVSLNGKGILLHPPALPLAEAPTSTLQLRNSLGACWGATYSAPATSSSSMRFRDRTP